MRAVVLHGIPLLAGQVVRVRIRGARLYWALATAESPSLLVHGSALVVPQVLEGKGAAGLTLCIRD